MNAHTGGRRPLIRVDDIVRAGRELHEPGRQVFAGHFHSVGQIEIDLHGGPQVDVQLIRRRERGWQRTGRDPRPGDDLVPIIGKMSFLNEDQKVDIFHNNCKVVAPAFAKLG